MADAPLEPGQLVVRTRSLFSESQFTEIEASRALRLALGRIIKRVGAETYQRILAIVLQHGAIRPPPEGGAFIRGFRITFIEESGVRVGFQITNNVGYALYVHPKGTPITRTIVNVDIRRGLVPQMRTMLRAEIEAWKRSPSFGKLMRQALLAAK